MTCVFGATGQQLEIDVRKVLFLIVLLFVPSIAFSAPSITRFDQDTGVISGSSFGTKSTIAPVAWDTVEDGTCDTTATVGAWTSVRDFTTGTDYNRANSSYTCAYNFSTNTHRNAAYEGGSDSQTWFGSYLFYFHTDVDLSGSLWNNFKFFRLWSSGAALENLRVSFGDMYDCAVAIESNSSIGTSYDWSPVVSGNDWVDDLLGHGDPGFVDPSMIGWQSAISDWAEGEWHQLQMEYRDSTAGTADGRIRIWFNGTMILDKDDIMTRDSGETAYKRWQYLGMENTNSSGSADGNDHYAQDDSYIDNMWSRVELCSGSTWAAKGICEMQPPTAWAASEVTVTVNNGAFSADDTAYLYVVDADGAVNSSGYEVEIGGGSSSLTSGSGATNMTVSGGGLNFSQ